MTQQSIRRRLIVPIIALLVVFFAVDAALHYRDSLASINTAYDRTLLASARAIGDGVKYAHEQVTVSLPYPALEVFEADTRSRMVYRVADFDGQFVSGYADLPAFRGKIESVTTYAALATFYEDRFQGETVRVAALLQPVNVGLEYRMATVQVAETLELRRQVALQALWQSLYRQVAMLILLACITWLVIGRALLPLRRLRQEVLTREPDVLDPLTTKTTRELSPVVEAMNEVMSRLRRVLDNRQRFVRDASHQLRTPLAVLKVQVQNARQGLLEPYHALSEIEDSVDRATRVANQMLALAKVAELGTDVATNTSIEASVDLIAVCRDVAVECSPLVSKKHLDFSLDTVAQSLIAKRAPEWMLRELLRNLVSNAIRYTPEGGELGIAIKADREDGRCEVCVWDCGPGISEQQRSTLYRPFVTSDREQGSGLGLIICRDICKAIGATLSIENRAAPSWFDPRDETATGLVVRIVLSDVVV
jgi:two-component system, OmpR family, sensor histidine kinase TctE